MVRGVENVSTDTVVNTMAGGQARDFADFYYEDVVIGATIETPAHTITHSDILRFGEVTLDRHPLHTDDAFCRDHTSYGGIIGHGLLGIALMEGLKQPLRLYYNTSPASLGWDKIRFKRPFFPGDRLHALIRFVDKRASSKPGRGVVRERIELFNQHDEVVTEAEHVTLLLMREREGAEQPPQS